MLLTNNELDETHSPSSSPLNAAASANNTASSASPDTVDGLWDLYRRAWRGEHIDLEHLHYRAITLLASDSFSYPSGSPDPCLLMLIYSLRRDLGLSTRGVSIP